MRGAVLSAVLIRRRRINILSTRGQARAQRETQSSDGGGGGGRGVSGPNEERSERSGRVRVKRLRATAGF